MWQGGVTSSIFRETSRGPRRCEPRQILHPLCRASLQVYLRNGDDISARSHSRISRKDTAIREIRFTVHCIVPTCCLRHLYRFVSAKRGGIAEDKSNFIALIRDLRAAFDAHGSNFILTAAIGAAAPTIDIAYDIPLMYKYLDFVHIMCYDYHGKWDRKTGHNAPLYARPEEKGQDLFLNVEYTLNYLIKKGAKPEKTVLGVPLYGRSFSLMNPHDHYMGSKAKTTSFQGPYTREDGFLGYNEICEEQMEQERCPSRLSVSRSSAH